MRTFLWVVLLVDQLFLLAVGATNLAKYDLTDFQLKEQLEGKHDAKSQLLRKLHKDLALVKRQQQLELMLAFAVGVTLFTELIEPPVVGLLWALASLLAIVIFKRIGVVQKYAHQLFEYSLEFIITVANWFKPLWWLVGLPPKTRLMVPQSEQELKDVIERTSTVSTEERARLASVLDADDKVAKDIMTKARSVKHVSPHATLGPVVLADLEKSGHRYFPVQDKKDGVIGMLNLRVVSDIGSAKSLGKVSDIMEEDVVWLPDDMPVFEVAQMFLNAKQYVLLVQNEEHEFAGIITVADLLKHTIAVEKNS